MSNNSDLVSKTESELSHLSLISTLSVLEMVEFELILLYNLIEKFDKDNL